VEALEMILRHGDWHPDLVPSTDLTAADLEALAEELVAFHTAFHACFGRIEHQRLGLGYLSGLLSNCGAKSVEPIALERLGAESVRSMQRFLKSYGWDHEAMEQTHASLLAAEIASADGMINVDSSEFLKKGRESVGVARQYCGAVGKVDNCQSGVFVGYSSDRGYGLLTAQLYLPAVWFTQAYEARRNQTLVPEDLRFQTKPQIALGLIETIVNTNQFPARWIGCDAGFGSDSAFLESLPQGLHYFASVRSDTQVFLDQPNVGLPPYKGRGRYPTKLRVLPGGPQPQSVADVAQSPLCDWTPTILAEGAKGPIVAEVARLRVYPSHEGLPKDTPVWLFLRRLPDGTIKYAFSDAPETIPFSDLCQASTMRWPIEQCFGDGKGQVGMDHYEHRSWPAWHRHMIYVFLALHFLHRLRIRFKKNPNPHRAPGPPTDRDGAPPALPGQARCAGHRALPHSAQLHRVSVT
jgi:SRSO17 transposase